MSTTDLNPGHIAGMRVLSPLRNFCNYNLQFLITNTKRYQSLKETTELKKKLLTFQQPKKKF